MRAERQTILWKNTIYELQFVCVPVFLNLQTVSSNPIVTSILMEWNNSNVSHIFNFTFRLG